MTAKYHSIGQTVAHPEKEGQADATIWIFLCAEEDRTMCLERVTETLWIRGFFSLI